MSVGPITPHGFTGPYAPGRGENVGIKPEPDSDEEGGETAIEPVDGDPSACWFTYQSPDCAGIARRLADPFSSAHEI